MAEIKVPASDLSRKTSSTSRKKSTVARKSGTPRQLGPSSRDKEARMQVMIDAAVALFSEEGYSAVSTRRIAERAGCSETLLFRYFGDKRGLLMAICNSLRGNEIQDDLLPEIHDVRDFIEQYLIGELHALKRQASSLKVVIAALINDPEMTADFEQKHDEAVSRVASRLFRFQETGALAANVDVVSLASAIEQLGFALGFLLQLVFDRPEAELIAIAKSSASVLAWACRPRHHNHWWNQGVGRQSPQCSMLEISSTASSRCSRSPSSRPAPRRQMARAPPARSSDK